MAESKLLEGKKAEMVQGGLRPGEKLWMRTDLKAEGTGWSLQIERLRGGTMDEEKEGKNKEKFSDGKSMNNRKDLMENAVV